MVEKTEFRIQETGFRRGRRKRKKERTSF